MAGVSMVAAPDGVLCDPDRWAQYLSTHSVRLAFVENRNLM